MRFYHQLIKEGLFNGLNDEIYFSVEENEGPTLSTNINCMSFCQSSLLSVLRKYKLFQGFTFLKQILCTTLLQR